ncbi:hypothetical protein NDU88_005139 [Pleurodeles waltl]|uniref:Uncharacterized protein n=1 Tax=Pleurodeles waltl TaxID=8319 RepID=A0AAV7N4Z8_PLEWA|nr:hypothetical protein NDU88_005139 [Pleurodeles waltl]
MVMYAGRDGMHRCRRDRHFLSVHSLATLPSTGEDLHCKWCCDLCLEPTMGRVTGERAPSFTAAELERLVDGVLPQYRMLLGLQTNRSPAIRRRVYCVPSPMKWGPWGSTADGAPTVGHGPETLGTEDGRDPAGDDLPMRQGCPSNPDLLMARILPVAYPELDGRLGTSQQPQGDEYSAPIYYLREVGWHMGGVYRPVGAPRPGRTLQGRSHVGQGLT